MNGLALRSRLALCAVLFFCEPDHRGSRWEASPRGLILETLGQGQGIATRARPRMTLRHTVARARLACLVGAAAGSIAGAAQAQTSVKPSLDERLEGPAAIF